MWVFPKIGVPQNGWFIMENPIKMDEFGGYPYFRKHPCRTASPRLLLSSTLTLQTGSAPLL